MVVRVGDSCSPPQASRERRAGARGATLTCALLLAFGCGQSRADGESAHLNTGGVGGTAGADAQSGGAGAGSGTGGAMAGTGSGGTSGGAAGSTTGGDTSMSGGRDGGGNAGTLGSVAGGGIGGTTAGAAGHPASGGVGTAGDAGAAGDGGHAGQPDVPDHDDFIIRSSAMSQYEGLTVYATFDHNIEIVSRSEPRSDAISGGSFELRWEQAFFRDSFGASVVLFVDRHGDGFCTEDGDPAWAAFANNLNDRGTPEVFDFDPALVPEGNLITCEEFNTWYGENFPGT